ncbi:MAG: UDP-3-O-(3-hydroxymyristoyl)glucosamine N-acyltransferase [Alphaproteobacteria bacterium]|nr:UDP-3-O-(3-hydroxymyristoyl)glucosamine N-acyltransferase [Alphaproteobacteria bacterium]MCK5659043.1 UDP-3-O-(3-hydroxymyristoyl)glucosamine N-acyltransferase [Alphaproteobacteria bacterium]
MADQRFFTIAKPFNLRQLAEITESELSNPSLADMVITDVAPLETAKKTHLSFFDNKKYLEAFKATQAGACFVHSKLAEFSPAETVCLINKNPYKAYAVAALAFYPSKSPVAFRASTALIDASAVIGVDCMIEDGVIIGKDVRIGDRCRIQAQTVIRKGVEIGNDCNIGSNVYVTHALIGSSVRIYPGACIGRPGFGFAIDSAGFTSVPQLGRVIIESNVEIGANTTIDRGAGPDTVIGQGTRIDNLVQIGHNVKIGKYCVVVAQVGISGSTQVGDHVMIGGQAGMAGHIRIGSGAKIAAQSGVMRNVPDGMECMGSPAVPIKQGMRQVAMIAKLVSKKGGDKT